MDNGQWTMDNGQWTMDNGQWTMFCPMEYPAAGLRELAAGFFVGDARWKGG